MSYLQKSKLKLNLRKSKLINFNKKRKILNLQIVKVGNILVSEAKVITYLRVLLDGNLNFNAKFKNTIQKTSWDIKLIYPIIVGILYFTLVWFGSTRRTKNYGN